MQCFFYMEICSYYILFKYFLCAQADAVISKVMNITHFEHNIKSRNMLQLKLVEPPKRLSCCSSN